MPIGANFVKSLGHPGFKLNARIKHIVLQLDLFDEKRNQWGLEILESNYIRELKSLCISLDFMESAHQIADILEEFLEDRKETVIPMPPTRAKAKFKILLHTEWETYSSAVQ